jgi:nitrite reductase/ring-hydroxylating ferredoxin subunit
MIDVGAVTDFPDRAVTLVNVGAREVGIVRWGGDLYAVSNVCTHQRGPLCEGMLSGRLTGAVPGDFQLDEETPVLACPWHGWEFDVRTGRALWDDRYVVRTYETRVAGRRVFVELQGRAS